MSLDAEGLDFSVLILPNPSRIPNPTQSDLEQVNNTLGFEIKLTSSAQFRTIYDTGGGNDGHLTGLPYVPNLFPSGINPCNDVQYIPANATRISNLPDGQYNLIGYAPWISEDCVMQYLQAGNDNRFLIAFVFYPLAINDTAGSIPAASAFDLTGGYGWVNYPVYVIDGVYGLSLMSKLAEYSGNMTDVPNGEALIAAGANPIDFARVFVEITLASTSPLPGLWVFLLIVIGVLLLIIALTSGFMHCVQYRNRQNLRRRVANGEVDLEAIGVRKLTVPRSIIDKFPVSVYIANPPEPNQPTSTQATASDPGTIPTAEIPTSSDATTSPPAVTHRHQQLYQPSCPICLEDFINQETMVRELPCRHIYHPECIDSFLENQSSLCPICKQSTNPGYVPPVLTNATVRRERLVRSMRQRQGTARTTAPVQLPAGGEAVEMTPVNAPEPAASMDDVQPTRRRTWLHPRRGVPEVRTFADADEEYERMLAALPWWRRILHNMFPGF